jgi:hypothetical protein
MKMKIWNCVAHRKMNEMHKKLWLGSFMGTHIFGKLLVRGR